MDVMAGPALGGRELRVPRLAENVGEWGRGGATVKTEAKHGQQHSFHIREAKTKCNDYYVICYLIEFIVTK